MEFPPPITIFSVSSINADEDQIALKKKKKKIHFLLMTKITFIFVREVNMVYVIGKFIYS